MPYPWKDLRSWINEEEELGNVLRIKEPIACGDYNNIVDIAPEEPRLPGKIPKTELRSLVAYLHSLEKNPIGFIEKPVYNRPDVPVLVNLWPDLERALRGVGCKDIREAADKFKRAISNPGEIEVVSKKNAPCKEVIIPEKDVDLTKLPRTYVEFNRWPWSPVNSVLVLYDPESGLHSLGNVRTGYFEWRDANPETPYPEDKRKKCLVATLIYAGPFESDSGRYYREKFLKKGKNMPGAITWGHPTDVHVIAASRYLRWPEMGDEYKILAGFRGEPIEVVESETIPGLMVPAYAEWVIEGEFTLEREPQPKHAEDIASGYMIGGDLCPVFRVKCVTHRKSPWWVPTWSNSGLCHMGVHTGLIHLTFADLDPLVYLRSQHFQVKNVHAFHGGTEIIVVQLEVDGADKPWPHYGKTVLGALYGSRLGYGGTTTKIMIAVGPDIDPYDPNDVLWAVATRAMPYSDSIIIPQGLAEWGDPGAKPGPAGWKTCLLYTSPSPRDLSTSRMPSSA